MALCRMNIICIKHKNDEHIIHFCDIVDSPLTNNDIYRLPMPDGFDNKEIGKTSPRLFIVMLMPDSLCAFFREQYI